MMLKIVCHGRLGEDFETDTLFRIPYVTNRVAVFQGSRRLWHSLLGLFGPLFLQNSSCLTTAHSTLHKKHPMHDITQRTIVTIYLLSSLVPCRPSITSERMPKPRATHCSLDESAEEARKWNSRARTQWTMRSKTSTREGKGLEACEDRRCG